MSYATSKKNADLVAKREAMKKIYEHNRDYFKMSLTLPLGNKALKKVHTNQWLFTDLPKQFVLQNWSVIAQALNSNTNRYEKYVQNRWYIDGVDINVEAGGKAEMKLSCNAFASTYNDYIDTAKSLQKAYTDAVSNKNTKSSSATKKTSNAVVKSTSNIKNGWWGKWVTNLVKKTVGKETDVLKRCKKMHELFRWHVYYSKYYDMKKTGGSVSKLEKNWSKPYFNCGDGANYLSAFYSACGAKTGIYLTYDSAHYIVKCTIGKKSYWCDQSGATNKHNTLRGFNQTWKNYRSGNYKGKYV